MKILQHGALSWHCFPHQGQFALEERLGDLPSAPRSLHPNKASAFCKAKNDKDSLIQGLKFSGKAWKQGSFKV